MTRARALAVTCVVLTAAVLGARPAQASLTQLTQATQIFSNPSLVKFDAAYDPTNKVYLVVWGKTQPGPITGIFLNAQGQPISGGFDLSVYNGYTSGWARVVYGAASGFMVTYTKSVGNPPSAVTLYARFLRYSTNGPVYGSGEIEIQQLGGNHPGSDEGVAYVPTTGTYISGFWLNPAFPQSFIKGVKPEGVITGPIAVTDGADGSSDPEISCDMTSNRCLVAGFSWGTPFIVNGRYTGATWGRLIDATTLQPIGPTPTYITGGARAENQGVAFSVAANQFIVGWVQNAREILGRNVDSNFGLGSPYVIRTGTSSNGNDCAFGYGQLNHSVTANAGAGTLAVGAVDWCGRAYIQELNANGSPADFKLASGLVTNENNPVVVANNEDKHYLFLHNYLTAAPRSVLFGASGQGPDPGPPLPPPGKPQPTDTIDLSANGAPNGSWYLAEGAATNTPGGFMTYYLIANENTVPVDVRVYYSSDDGRLLTETVTVGAGRRYTIDLRDRTGAGSFATVFQSLTAGYDVFVERSMYFGTGFEGSTGATAVKTLSQSWVFPEGSRGGEYFRNYFLLFNPSPTPSDLTARFFLNDGTSVARTYTVPARGRLTIDANGIDELAGRDFATTFMSTQPVVAERAMYWGSPWHGGTASVGVTGGWHAWLFAEGAAAPNFETFYLILNGNSTPITVRGAFFEESGFTHVRHYTIPANSRSTVYLNQELGLVGGVAAQFDSSPDTPFAVERAVYWGVGRVEGTTSVGVPRGATEWHLPEGASGPFDTFLLLANPSGVPVTVDVTLFIEGVGRFTAPASMRPVLQPFSRKTINMNEFLSQLGTLEGIDLSVASFATRLRVVGDVAPIVAEHAIYWNRDGANYWRAGAGSFGIVK
jgi:hypothetical protein